MCVCVLELHVIILGLPSCCHGGNTVSAQSPHTAALCVFAWREPRTFGFICFRVGVSLRFPPFCDCYLKLHFGRRPWRAPSRHPLMQPQTNLLTAIQRCPSGHLCVLPAGHWPRHLRACLSQASWLTAGLTFPGRYIGCYAAVFLVGQVGMPAILT